MSAYVVTAQDGTRRLKVPELNLFDVVIDRVDGRHEQYTNIQFGEPEHGLFEPPPGASVSQRAFPTEMQRH